MKDNFYVVKLDAAAPLVTDTPLGNFTFHIFLGFDKIINPLIIIHLWSVLINNRTIKGAIPQ